MLAGIRFTRAVLMVRGTEGLARATEFYRSGLGLKVVQVADDWAELECGNSFTISLNAVTNEPQVSTGYSPHLSFEVKDMDSIISKCLQKGGHLDGPIQYPAHGKVASLRSPDGHLIGLYEPAK